MTNFWDRADVTNYALASHEVKIADLREGDKLDIRGGALVVRIRPVLYHGEVMGVFVDMLSPHGVTVRSYDETDIVSVLV